MVRVRCVVVRNRVRVSSDLQLALRLFSSSPFPSLSPDYSISIFLFIPSSGFFPLCKFCKGSWGTFVE